MPPPAGRSPLASAGLAVVGLGWSAVTFSASVVIADAVDPRERGRAIGVSDASSGRAWLIFPLLAGPLLGLGGLPSIGGLGVVVTLAALAVAVPEVARVPRCNTALEL